MKTITHAFAASSLALTITQPVAISTLISTLITSSLGGSISDLDGIKKRYQPITDIILTLVGIIMMFIYCSNKKFIPAIGIGIIAVILLFGKHQRHRTFLHSIMGLFLIDINLLLINDNFALPFTIGYISHILLDIITIRKVKLLYPLNRGLSLKLSVYNGKLNIFIFLLSIIINNAYILLRFL